MGQKKLFAAVWTSAAFEPAVQTVELAFFSEDLGYTPEESAEIAALEIGQR